MSPESGTGSAPPGFAMLRKWSASGACSSWYQSARMTVNSAS